MYRLLILFPFLFLSCGNSEEVKVEQSENSSRAVYSYGWNTHVRVFEVDSCEYIGFDAGSEGGTSIIHKQNCNFCAKRNEK